MARYDKYDPISGGFRAKLAATLPTDPDTGEFGPAGVSLDAAGHVVVGTGGQSGLVGVLVKNAPRQGITGRFTSSHGLPNPAAPIGTLAGDVVDIMTDGEIVEVDGLLPGQRIYAAADGTLTATAAGNTPVGYTVEASRLVVRCSSAAVAAV